MPREVACPGDVRSRFSPIELSSALACASLAGAAKAGVTLVMRGNAAVAERAPSVWRRENIIWDKLGLRAKWLCSRFHVPRDRSIASLDSRAYPVCEWQAKRKH